MYFFVILRLVHKRTFQYNPVLNTSIRGHGKWGDFLVAVIPLSWCGNILVNSNFILRMIEWQNESSLFTLRVQGKQWYWVYKFDASAASSILSAPKNIGHNKWFVSTPQESYCFDNYYQALHLGTQIESRETYLKELKKADITTNSVKNVNLNSNLLAIPYSELTNNFFKLRTPERVVDLKNSTLNNEDLYLLKIYNIPVIDNQTNFNGSLLTSNKKKPLSFISGVLNKHNIEILQNAEDSLNKPIIFCVKFWTNDGLLEKKDTHDLLQWGFKQKRYKRLDKFQFTPRIYYTKDFLYNNVDLAKTKEMESLYALNNALIDTKNVTSLDSPIQNLHSLENDIAEYHVAVKYNRHRGELVPTNLARRLLRTKRTLVLPAHVNITVVTNSYDVVHSWFIPGLGLKLDCVPGRSTHHSFYIDNIGFYYGQCAEICGRYHHHMPIRLCALPFEQFLVWWQKKGVARLNRLKLLNNKSPIDVNAVKFKYRW